MSLDEFFTPDSSLFEANKYGNLVAKQEQKASRLLDAVNPSGKAYIPMSQDSSVGGNLGGLAASGGIQELSDEFNATKDLANLAGADFQMPAGGNYSGPLQADKFVGLDPRVRQNLHQQQQQAMTDVANGDVINSIVDIAKAAPGTLADSSGTLGSSIAGSLAIGAAGSPVAGIANEIKSLRRIYNKFSKLGDEYKAVKKANQAIKASAKALAQSSFMNVAETERQVQQYRDSHGGRNPTADRFATMAIGAAITQTAEIGILKHLYLPKGKESLNAIKSLINAMKPNSSAIASMAKRIGSGMLKMSEAGGAEGVQEYLQTWQQLLSQKVDPKTGQTLYDAVMEQVNNKENQQQAAGAAALGVGAGGLARGITTIPATGVGLGVDATTGTVKTIAKGVTGTLKYAANRNSRNNLSEEDKQNFHTEYEAAAQVSQQKLDDLQQQADIIKNAKSFDDLQQHEEVARKVEELRQNLNIPQENLSNPKVLKQVKKALQIDNKKVKTVIQKELGGSNLAHFKHRTGNPLEEDTVAPTQESVDNLVETVNSASKESENTPSKEAITQAANELETQSAVDTVKDINKDPSIVPGRVLQRAQQLSAHDLERVAALVSHTNPEAAKALQKLHRRRTSAQNAFSPKGSKIIDDSNIDSFGIVGDVAKGGITNETHIPNLSATLSAIMHKNIKGLNTIKTLQNAISHYENSEAFKKQGKGVIHPRTLAKWKKRLDNLAKREEAQAKEESSTSKKTSKENSSDSSKQTSDKKSSEETPDTSNESSSQASEETSKETPSDTTSKEQKPPKEETTKATSEKTPSKPEVKASKSVQTFIHILVKEIDEGTNLNDGTQHIFKELPKLVAQLSKEGYRTNKDFNDLIEQYPSLKKNAEVYNLLKLALYNPNEEEDSTVPSKKLTLEESKEAYRKLFPECKV